MVLEREPPAIMVSLKALSRFLTSLKKKIIKLRNKFENGEFETVDHPVASELKQELDDYLIIKNRLEIVGEARLIDDEFKTWLNKNRSKFINDFQIRKI